MGNPQAGGASAGPDVFVSYAREDRVLAGELVRLLRAEGITVTWDADLAPATDFRIEIERLLDESRLVLVLWSGWSVRSDHVRDEADFARERHKLVPASLDGSQPPLGFRGWQTEDLRGWVAGARHPGVDRLMTVISGRLARPGSPPPPSPAPRPVPPRVRPRRKPASRVALWLLAVVFSLALLGLLVVVGIRVVQSLTGDGGGVEVHDFRVDQILDLCEVNVSWLTSGEGNTLDVLRDGVVVAEDLPASVGNLRDRDVGSGQHVYTLVVDGEQLDAEAPLDLQC